jgi:hypothetical protein
MKGTQTRLSRVTRLPVLPAFGVNDSPIGKSHQKLARLVADVDEAVDQAVDLLQKFYFRWIDVARRHGGRRVTLDEDQKIRLRICM